ncbi:MAG TPA: argininosuccinate lyase [Acidobacteriaceae bacterium]|jgi:argininosuccinate lyase|nr:argininosuccinate lyase [Acidobacteriaceae bacterium]
MSDQPAKMWSGRFRAAPDPQFEAWQRSLGFDGRLLPQEVAASKAHARAIAAAGILTPAELETTLCGLDTILARVIPAGSGNAVPAAMASSEAEDIHHFVELSLTAEIGDLALKLHTGRSRNEQIATDLRLFVRDSIAACAAQLTAWALALLEQAREAETAAMPSYTHLQRAEPVLIAHWLLAYVEMILRDISRFEDCRVRLNFCPLGSGAVAGATLALDRTIASRELGFTAPTANSMDATSDRDFALEFAQAASTLGIHLSRFAEELTLYSTAEFGFLDLPEEFSTGSSAMPQKKNPDLTELLRGKSGRLLGAATTLATLLKGLPLAYNKDMQETQEPVFEVADTLAGILRLLPDFTRALNFRHDRMLAATQSGFLNAMAAATYLVHKGVPFRKAHEKIGHAVRYCVDKKCELGDLSLYEIRQFGEEFEEDFFAAISLQATLDCHDVLGGTARNRVHAALADAQTRVQSLAARHAPPPVPEVPDARA